MKLGRDNACIVSHLYNSISTWFFKEWSEDLQYSSRKWGGGGHSAKFNFYFAAVRVKPLGRYLIVITWYACLLWPWPWPLTYIWKTLILSITVALYEKELSYFAYMFLVTVSCGWYEHFWSYDLDRDLWPTFEIFECSFVDGPFVRFLTKFSYQSINLLDHIYSASNNCIIIYHRRRGTQRISWQWIKMNCKDTCINLQCHRYKWPQFLSESGIYKYSKCRYAFSTCITPSPNKSLFKKV